MDTGLFQNFLEECVLGSLQAARHVGEMAVVHLTVPNPPAGWWGELLEYEQGFFLQIATADPVPLLMFRATVRVRFAVFFIGIYRKSCRA